MTTHLSAELEIDHDRGVIYVHLARKIDILDIGTITVLRIQGLPQPIPQLGLGNDQRSLLDLRLDVRDPAPRYNWEGK